MRDMEKSSNAKAQIPEREVDPASNPGPRGNADLDPGRVARGREDYERAGAN